MLPQTHYAQSGSVNIAYQVFGSGGVDLVFVPGWVSNLDANWDFPGFVNFLEGLGRFARVILFDKRGTGLSDRVMYTATLEERMDDLRAVMDAVGSRRAALFGISEGASMSMLFAVTYPERMEALILLGGYARMMRGDDHPWGRGANAHARVLESMRKDWGSPASVEPFLPSSRDDPSAREFLAKLFRSAASPAMAVALYEANAQIDVRHLLPSIRVPTLLIHAKGDRISPVEGSRYMQERIPGARLVELESEDHLAYLTDQADAIVGAMQEFLTGQRAPAEPDRMVCTIMFTDIVESTRHAVELGDGRWRELLGRHHAIIRQQLAAYRGREINTSGDGFYAGFDGPARAIACGKRLVEAVKPLGLSIRVGIHTGECEVKGGEMTGLAIHIGARVSAAAPPDTVLVSQTVKDLVAGGGIEFEDFGLHTLKGVPDERRLWAVRAVTRGA